jgi:hypothetical protein
VFDPKGGKKYGESSRIATHFYSKKNKSERLTAAKNSINIFGYCAHNEIHMKMNNFFMSTESRRWHFHDEFLPIGRALA